MTQRGLKAVERRFTMASTNLDCAAWRYAASYLLMQSNPADDGTSTNNAWHYLQSAAIRFADCQRKRRDARRAYKERGK